MATQPFVIVPALTAVAVLYKNGQRIADNVFPRVPVLTQVFRYNKYSLAEAFQSPDTRVGRKSAPNQIDFGSTELTDQTFDEGLDSPVPNADILAHSMAAQAGTMMVNQVGPLEHHTMLVQDAVQNRREFRAAALATNLANYATGNKQTLAGVTQWSDYTNSDPIRACKLSFDAMIMRPNYGWMGREVLTQYQMHPKVCKAVFGNNTDAGIVPVRAIADLLGLEDIFVGDAYINTAKPGQPPVISRCWGKDAGFFHRNMVADTRGGVTFGMTAQWGDRIAGTIEDPDIGLRGGVRVRSGESVKELITANDLGYLFKNAVA